MNKLSEEIEENMNDVFSSRITIYQVKDKTVNQGHTEARARVLYKGKNRNKTYINDTFANLLKITAPYIPIVGEYDTEAEDFLGHTKDAIPYGCVVQDNNFAWEEHLDKDGFTRTYACFDVILWTKKYEVANEIVNKALSMELDKDTIEGTFKVQDGETLYHFTGGELLALCTLGDDVEPCFEGAAFYQEYSKKPEFAEFDKFVKKLNNNENGGNDMEKRIIEFKLSHDEVRGMLWEAANGDSWKYGIAKVYDEYALMYDYEEGKYLRQYYSKTDDSVELGDSVEVVIEDLTIEEYEALKAERNSKSDFEEKYNDLNTEYAKLEKDLEEKKTEIETLAEEKGNFEKEVNELKEKYSDYEELTEYKLKKETEEKKALIAEYESMVPADFSFNLKEDLSAYTIKELESELAVKAIKEVKGKFSKESNEDENENLGDFNLKDSEIDEDSWIALVKKNKSNK